MNSIKYFISLLIFSSFSFANPVETGHANVSIVKFDTDSSLKNELFIGIKMDMQKNWHTYWKNPGDSGGPIEVLWNLPENVTIEGPYWPTPQLLPYPHRSPNITAAATTSPASGPRPTSSTPAMSRPLVSLKRSFIAAVLSFDQAHRYND